MIETLVALTVAAIAAAVISASLHGLRQRAEQEQALANSATLILNASAQVNLQNLVDWVTTPEPGKIVMTPRSGNPKFAIGVRNFSLQGEKLLPPVEIAYTPIQQFSLEISHDDRVTFAFLKPSLPPPGGYAKPAASTNP